MAEKEPINLKIDRIMKDPKNIGVIADNLPHAAAEMKKNIPGVLFSAALNKLVEQGAVGPSKTAGVVLPSGIDFTQSSSAAAAQAAIQVEILKRAAEKLEKATQHQPPSQSGKKP